MLSEIYRHLLVTLRKDFFPQRLLTRKSRKIVDIIVQYAANDTVRVSFFNTLITLNFLMSLPIAEFYNVLIFRGMVCLYFFRMTAYVYTALARFLRMVFFMVHHDLNDADQHYINDKAEKRIDHIIVH